MQLNLDTRWADKHPTGYVVCENGCWEWVGRIDRNGYGIVRRGGRNHYAHRWYFAGVGENVPADKMIDHLCRNHRCIRPDHLEVVTNQVNCLRGIGPTAINAAKTTCPRGHKYDMVQKNGDHTARRCRRCRRELDNRNYAKRMHDARTS